MSNLFKDRVRESSTSTGTGSFTLAGAVAGFQSFNAAFGTGQDLYYVIEAVNSSGVPTGEWEVGLGQLSDATTLVRSQVLASSNAGSAVDFAAGTKNVFCSVPADYLNNLGSGGGALNVSAGASSQSLTNLVFRNSNGITFGLSNSTITASHNGITDSSPFRLTANDSQLRFTSQDSQLQFTSANSNFQSAGPYLTTAMRSDAITLSNIKISGGTLSSLRSDISFNDSNGISWGLNTNGVMTATVKTDYQTSGNYLTTAMRSDAVTLSNIKVSAGTKSALRSDISFNDSNGISFGLESNGVVTATVRTDYQSSGNYLTTADLSQNSSKYAGTNGAITGGSITVNTSGVSVNLPAYITTADLSQNSSKYFQNWKLTGNTSGTTSSAQGTDVWLSGGQGITVSGNSNSIVFSIGSYITTADLSQNSSKYVQNWKLTGNTAGTTSSAQGTDFWLAGGNNVTVSGSSNTISVSVGNYITTADLSQNSSKYVQNWKLTGNTAGTTSSAQGTDFWISGGANVTVSGSSNSIVVSAAAGGAFSGGVSNVGNTSGNTGITGTRLIFAGGNSITLSQATDANGATISVSAGNYLTTAMASNAATISNINISGGTTSSNLSNFKLIDSNGVSWSLDTGSKIYATVKTDYLTTAMQSNAATISNINISGGTTSSNLSNFKFIDSNGVSWSLDTGSKVYATVKTDYLTTADLSQNSSKYFQNWKLTGNTLGTASSAQGTDLWLSAGANITLSGSSNSIVISGASAAPSPVNVSAGTTSGNLATIVFSNSNQVSFGLNGSTITGSVPGTSSLSATGNASISVNGSTISIGANAPLINFSGGNSVGNTFLASTGGTVAFYGGNQITLSLDSANQKVSISGLAPATLSYFANLDFDQMVTGGSAITQTSGSSMFIQPFALPNYQSVGFIRFLASFNDSAVGTAGTPVANSTFSVGRFTTFGINIFTQGVGANSRSLQQYTSTSGGMTGKTNVGAGTASSQYTISISKTYPATGADQNYTTSYNVSSASIVISSNSNTLFTGPRFLDLSFGMSLSPGNYWLAVGMSTSSASQSANISFAGTAGLAISLAAKSQSNVSVGILGAATSASDNQLQPGLGVWTTNSSAFTTNSIGMAQISQVVSNPILPFTFYRSA